MTIFRRVAPRIDRLGVRRQESTRRLPRWCSHRGDGILPNLVERF
jgi:hypothetical protein